MGSRSRNSTRAEPSRGRTADLERVAATVRLARPERAQAIAARLAELWPDAVVELDHANAYQLLVATILAAQSTDKLINTVTPALFAKYPDPAAMARADQAELEKMIFSTGFYRMKAKHVIGMARRVVDAHGGKIPETMAELVELPGVARKTANVVLGSALGKNEGIVVDTHVSRLAPRLGLTAQTEPVKIEQELIQLVPRDQWSIFAHRLIWHGRRVCHAKKPDCEHCTLAPLCPSNGIAGTAATAPPRTGRQPLTRAQAAKAAEARTAGTAPPRTERQPLTRARSANARAAAAATQASRPTARTAASPATQASRPTARTAASPATQASRPTARTTREKRA